MLARFAVATGLIGLLSAVSAQDASPSASLAASSSTASSAPTPKIHVVTVGKADHKMVPDVVTADPGDIITFQFFPKNHSVVRAEYEYPCIPYEMTGRDKVGFFSGFQPVDLVLDDVCSPSKFHTHE
jgi:hypothetical protein